MTAYEYQLVERGLEGARHLSAIIAEQTKVTAAAAALEHQRYALAGQVDPPPSEIQIASKCAKVLTDVLGIKP